MLTITLDENDLKKLAATEMSRQLKVTITPEQVTIQATNYDGQDIVAKAELESL